MNEMPPKARSASASVAPRLIFVAEMTIGARKRRANGFSMPPVRASIEVNCRISKAKMGCGFAFAQDVDVRVVEIQCGVERDGNRDHRDALSDRHFVFQAEEDDHDGDDLADDAQRANGHQRAQANAGTCTRAFGVEEADEKKEGAAAGPVSRELGARYTIGVYLGFAFFSKLTMALEPLRSAISRAVAQPASVSSRSAPRSTSSLTISIR